MTSRGSRVVTTKLMANPVSKTALRMARATKRPTLGATVHYGAIWVNTHGLSDRQISKLAGALLDAGIPVRGYWADLDYTNIDPRISSEGGRVR